MKSFCLLLFLCITLFARNDYIPETDSFWVTFYRYGKSSGEPMRVRGNSLTIPDTLTKMPVLDWLELEGAKGTKLSESIVELDSLEGLFISSPTMDTLPDFIGKLKRLQTLKIDAPNLRYISESLCSLSRLRKLTIKSEQEYIIPEGIMDLNLWSLELAGAFQELPTLNGDIDTIKIYGDSLREISWSPISNPYRGQSLRIESSSLTSLPQNLKDAFFASRVNLNGDTQLIPLKYWFTSFGALIPYSYGYDSIPEGDWSPQWMESLYKHSGEVDTVIKQILVHRSGLPLKLQHHRHPKTKSYARVIEHGYSYTSRYNKYRKQRTRESDMYHFGYRTYEKSLTETFSLSQYKADSLIADFRTNRRQYKRERTLITLDNSHTLMAEIFVHKKSGDTVTYDDGTPYLYWDYSIAAARGDSATYIDDGVDDTLLAMSYKDWLMSSDAEKHSQTRSLKRQGRNKDIAKQAKEGFNFRVYAGGGSGMPFSMELSPSWRFGGDLLFGPMFFAEPGYGGVRGGVGVSLFGSENLMSRGLIVRYVAMSSASDKYGFREEVYSGPEIGWQGFFLSARVGKMFSHDSSDVQVYFSAGLSLSGLFMAVALSQWDFM